MHSNAFPLDPEERRGEEKEGSKETTRDENSEERRQGRGKGAGDREDFAPWAQVVVIRSEHLHREETAAGFPWTSSFNVFLT